MRAGLPTERRLPRHARRAVRLAPADIDAGPRRAVRRGTPALTNSSHLPPARFSEARRPCKTAECPHRHPAREHALMRSHGGVALDGGVLHREVFLHLPGFHGVLLPPLLHLALHLQLPLVGLLLVFVLLSSKLVLHLLLLILQDGLVRLLLQASALLVRGLRQAHKLIVGLLVNAHLIRPQLLVYLQVVLLLLLRSSLAQGVFLNLVLLLQHFDPLLKLELQAVRVRLLLLLDGCRIRKPFGQLRRRSWSARRLRLPCHSGNRPRHAHQPGSCLPSRRTLRRCNLRRGVRSAAGCDVGRCIHCRGSSGCGVCHRRPAHDRGLGANGVRAS
mmetsp:Transcript_53057/g.152949  ORF Transcript_53057/g.152949 Transcript_53057/m.152949 type:complete len:331 (-) Transcript_53057:453-1445(-)